MLYLIKVLTSAIILVAASELARRSTTLGALLLALPLVSILAFTWFWLETRDAQQLASLSFETLWFVVPTLPLFAVLGWMLKQGFGYFPSLAAGCALTAVLVWAMQTWFMK